MSEGFFFVVFFFWCRSFSDRNPWRSSAPDKFFNRKICISLFALILLTPGWAESVFAGQGSSSSRLSGALIMESQTLQSVLGSKKEKEGLESFLESSESLTSDVSNLVVTTGIDLIRRRPELKERIEREIARGQVGMIAQVPVVLFGNSKEDDVLRSWRDQLKANLKQIEVISVNDPKEVSRHQWIWYEDYRKDRRNFFCALQLRDCLKEAVKLAQLMTAKSLRHNVVKDKVIFEETFAQDFSKWRKFGEGKATIKDGMLFMKGSPLMVWTTGESFSGDCLIALDFRPDRGRGGVIFAFPGVPVKGLDYSVSAGRSASRSHLPPGNRDIMEPYNHGIHTYHVSVHRRRTHLRRVGAGLKMLNVLQDDPCAKSGKTYRVELLKVKETFQFLVDGKLIHSYFDAGVYGPVLTKGHFGIKQFGKLATFYDNVRIYRLKTGGADK